MSEYAKQLRKQGWRSLLATIKLRVRSPSTCSAEWRKPHGRAWCPHSFRRSGCRPAHWLCCLLVLHVGGRLARHQGTTVAVATRARETLASIVVCVALFALVTGGRGSSAGLDDGEFPIERASSAWKGLTQWHADHDPGQASHRGVLC